MCIRVLLITVSALFFCSCHKTEKAEYKIELMLYNVGEYEVSPTTSDSTYALDLLPIIKNSNAGNITLIGRIYGRSDRDEFDLFPKYGMNIYKEGKKVEFTFYRGCGNYGYLQTKDFVTIPPNGYFLPFLDYKTGVGSHYSPEIRIKERGEMEVEFYYSMKDSTQLKYHPIYPNEIKYPIAIEEYNEIRPYFLKTSRLDLKSNRVKIVFL